MPLRVVILGNSGSGKSTLAAALAAIEPVPCLDLDTVAWEPGDAAVLRSDALAQAEVRSFCESHPGWIVEGCYANLVEAALACRPVLLFLDPGVEACQANCRARPWEPHKYPSREAQDAHLPFLLSWVADYYRRSGPLSREAHAACFDAYGGPKRELRTVPGPLMHGSDLLEWIRSNDLRG